MADTWKPLIIAAEVLPTPALAGQSALVRVIAVDVFGAEQTETRYSGEFYSAEV